MWHLLLVAAALFCAFQVVRAERLLMSTLWLALTSATVAILLYMLGGLQVAVIELSVGAGLVTVLFVFAFSIVGEHTLDRATLVPAPLVWGLILVTAFLLGWFTFPLTSSTAAESGSSFGQMLWEQRGLDILAQIVLIFGAVLGLLGLLAGSGDVAAEAAGKVNAAAYRGGPQTVPVPTNGKHLQAEPDLEELKA